MNNMSPQLSAKQLELIDMIKIEIDSMLASFNGHPISITLLKPEPHRHITRLAFSLLKKYAHTKNEECNIILTRKLASFEEKREYNPKVKRKLYWLLAEITNA